MSQSISRRSIAKYAVAQITDGTPLEDVVTQVAAYLIETGRVREADLVVRAIEDEFAARGTVIARVTTAQPLTDTLRGVITSQLAAKAVSMKEIVDPAVIGGVRIETADQLFDGTIKRKLLTLRHQKV